jgi:hypothetical protein
MLWTSAFKSKLRETKFQLQLLTACSAAGLSVYFSYNFFKKKIPHTRNKSMENINADNSSRQQTSSRAE